MKEMIVMWKLKYKRICSLLGISFIACCFILWTVKYTHRNLSDYNWKIYEHNTNMCKYSVWPALNLSKVQHFDLYSSLSCYPDISNNKIDASQLPNIIKRLSQNEKHTCSNIADVFYSIYTVSIRSGTLVLPSSFVPKVKQWLSGSEDLLKQIYNQEIYHIFNEYTYEHTIYNPIRGKRPINKPDRDQRQYLIDLVKSTRDSCDFCHYKNMTAEDEFGRLESELSFSAANTFKYDGWHTMFNLKIHDPLAMTEAHIIDMFNLAIKWCGTVHSMDSSQRFAHIVWDMTVRGGGSQLHPHIQASIANEKYYGLMEFLRAGSEAYYHKTDRVYFEDLALLHMALGYGVELGEAVAIAPITPKKDFEMMILSKEVNEDVYKLLYQIIRVYFDSLEVFSFSFSMVLPELGGGGERDGRCGRMPVVARIVPRGDLTNPRQDISALELFTVYNVNDNPYRVPQLLSQRLRSLKDP